jgi:hypothetical protein
MKHDLKYYTKYICALVITGLCSFSPFIHVYAENQLTDNIDRFFAVNGTIVTKDLYPRVETARQMLQAQAFVGVNQFSHLSKLVPTDFQPVVRMNRDAYYSKAVVNVSQGATITLPKVPEGTYMSMQPVTEDHRPQAMSYGPGTYQLATHTGEHMIVIIRLDSNLSTEKAKQYQKEMIINAGSNERFYAQTIEPKSFARVENQLKADAMKLMKKEGRIKIV